MGALRGIHALQHGAELVRGVGFLASDLELDDRRVPAGRDLARMTGIQRRCDVLNGFQLGNASHDIRDGGVEGRRTHLERAALDQDALVCGQLEAGVQDAVHAPRLTGPGGVRIDVLDAHDVADLKRDDDEGEPAEGGCLPVGRAPATHAGCQVAVTVGLGAGHERSPFSPRAHGISTAPTLVTVVRSAT